MATPSLSELLRLSVVRILQGTHTALPGYVVAYSASTQTADVRPQIKMLSNLPGRLKTLAELPVLPDIPVCWHGGGGLGIHAPLAAGDTVLIVFCERSIDRWRQGTGSTPVDPGDQRMHELTGAVCIPLLRRASAAWTGLAAGSTLNLGATTGTGLDFVALAAKVLTELQNIRTTFNAHTHSGVTAGGGTSGAPSSPMAAPSSVAAANVKAT